MQKYLRGWRALANFEEQGGPWTRGICGEGSVHGGSGLRAGWPLHQSEIMVWGLIHALRQLVLQTVRVWSGTRGCMNLNTGLELGKSRKLLACSHMPGLGEPARVVLSALEPATHFCLPYRALWPVYGRLWPWFLLFKPVSSFEALMIAT